MSRVAAEDSFAATRLIAEIETVPRPPAVATIFRRLYLEQQCITGEDSPKQSPGRPSPLRSKRPSRSLGRQAIPLNKPVQSKGPTTRARIHASTGHQGESL